MTILSRDHFIQQAQDATGLTDFGNDWFFANIDALIPSMNSQAQLSDAGTYGAGMMIQGALERRLRHIDLLNHHPEILDEVVNVRCVLSGLPRTGSTMLHRMLASTDELTAVRWFEAQNYVPLAGETRGDAAPRQDAAKGILDYMLQVIPELMSIHPMSIDQPDEEVIILGQLFSSSMIESTYFVPDYADWLSEQDPRPAYEDLITILKSLQWQDQNRRGKEWVLITPGHLMSMNTVLEVFPKAKIVMTHRDPVATAPSYCSMMASLYKMGSDTITNEQIGQFWPGRLKNWLDRFMTARTDATSDRFIDVNYKDQLSDPITEASRVLEASGLSMTEALRSGMSDWIDANKREHRAPHKYALEDFGLTAAGVEDLYSGYREKYLGAK